MRSGHGPTEAYTRVLEGVRAVKRGQQPRKSNAHLLRDVATVLIDCGLGSEERFRLKWQDNFRHGAIEIHTGKGRGSRRRIPASRRVLGVLEMRRAGATSEWVFPAETKSGHIEGSTLKKQHAAALMASGVVPFVLYTLRHTCITRWAKHMDPFTLHVLAGHTDMNTTKRYVHPSEADILEAMEKVRGTYKVGHSLESAAPKKTVGVAAIQQERSGYVVHTPSFVASRWNTLVALGAVSRRTTEDIAVPKYLVVFGIRLGRAERTEEITIDCASEGLQQEASKRKREEEDLWNSENDTGKAINVRVVQVLPL